MRHSTRGRAHSCAVITALATLFLAACGSDSSSSMGTIQGVAYFERVVPQASGGLSYAGMTNAPIRGARIEARDPHNNALWSVSTVASDGSFSLKAPADRTARVVIRAELAVAGGTVAVRNAGSTATSGPVWGIYEDVPATGAPLRFATVIATSGWLGNGYDDSARGAGAFAILDTLYRARALIRSVSFDDAPPLDVFWGPHYTVATIGTSFYDPGSNLLRILGGQNEDTDEYDHNVIAHEWAHAYTFNLSRDDSLGGAHGVGDYLDETVAFSEAFANAASGMVMGNTNYYDTMGFFQGVTEVSIDLLDMDPPNINPGPWDEFGLTPLIFNLYHPSGANLGFQPIHATLRGPFRTRPQFSTIYSFLRSLKLSLPSQASTIAGLAQIAGIHPAHDAFEGPDYFAGSGYRYTEVPTDGSIISIDVDGDPMRTYTTYTRPGDTLPGNKLYNRLFFRTLLPAGTWTIRAMPTDADGFSAAGDLVLWVASHGRVDDFANGSEQMTISVSAQTEVAFAVGAFAGGQHFAVQVFNANAPSVPVPEADG